MVKNKRISIEVVEEKAVRYVISHYADGTETRTLVDPNQKPRRKPSKPIARARAHNAPRSGG